MAAAILKSSSVIGVAGTRWCPFSFLFPVGLFLFPFSLFFSLPCWFVLTFLEEVKDFGVDPERVVEEVRCGAENVTNTKAIEGRKSTNVGKPVLEEKCWLKTKGTMLSSVEERVKTRMFQGFSVVVFC